jgi:hypothetical protein
MISVFVVSKRLCPAISSAAGQCFSMAVVGFFVLSGAPFADASWILQPDFTQVSTKPAITQNSTAVSVAVNSASEILASGGYEVATVAFDGSPSTSVDLPFTSAYRIVTGMRFDETDRLNLLLTGFPPVPGGVWRSSDSGFSEHVRFQPPQRASEAFAFESSGNMIAGGYGANPGDDPWIRRYNPSGSVVADFDVPPSSSFLGGETPVGFALTSQGSTYMATWDGRLIAVSNTGLNTVAQLPAAWVGPGAGHLESFAIDADDNFFFGANLGQRFGMNSGAILRLKGNEVDVLALGLGEIPTDLLFTPNNELLVAGFNPYSGSKVFKFSGDFSTELPVTVPEPASIVLSGIGTLVLAGYLWRRANAFR